MRSSQLILPGESPALFAETEKELLEAINPTDAVQRMLADRVVECHWYRLRGQRATEARASEVIDEIVEGADDRDAREVERLALLLDEGDPDALRQLRSFPAGVAYLLEQWTILQDRLAKGLSLLYSQRCRCFALLGKPSEGVLRDEPVATRWLRAQIGVILDREGTLNLDDVAGFLGGRPPANMGQAEFDIRVQELAVSVVDRVASLHLLKGYVRQAIADLKAHQASIQELADRKRHHATVGATVDSTPEGIRLANYIHANEKGCDAALRRLEIRQKPQRGPGRSKSESGDPTPVQTPDPDSSKSPGPATPVESEPDYSTVEAIEPEPVEPQPDCSTVEALEPATVEPQPDCSTVEALEPATVDSELDFSTVEAIEPAPLDSELDFSTVEAIDDGLDAADGLERFGPEAEHLRKLHRFLTANYGGCGPIDSERPDGVGPASVSDQGTDGVTIGVDNRPP